jgi:hypothetical protein
MWCWLMSIITGTAALVLGVQMFFRDEADLVQGRFLGLLAILLAASAVFRALDLWENKS